MIASFVFLLSHLLYGLRTQSFSYILAVTVFAIFSKILAKNIWQGAGEIECLIVFLFACVLFFFLKRGRNMILSGEKNAVFLKVTQEQGWILFHFTYNTV